MTGEKLSVEESGESLSAQRSTTALIHNVVDSDAIPAKEKKQLKKRDTWAGKFDFLLACTGTAVGLGNVWRFPYLCFKNGGGAFLIPYIVVVIFSGIPIFFLEVALGQFTKLGAVKAWNAICPLLSGIGIASVAIIFYTMSYYAVVLAYALFYLFQSFRAELPWVHCNNTWNTPKCEDNYSMFRELNLTTQEIKDNFSSPVEEYWERRVLDISSGVDDLGGLRGELVGYLFLAWFICYLTVFKGTKSSGKAMYVTATFPYVMLFILLIRGVTLPGAMKGIEFYLKPNMTKLLEPQVWVDAGTQVFFSYSLCIGVLVSLGSFNAYNNNCLRDTVIIAVVNSGTSILAGFAIFSALGYMATEMGVEVKDVARGGPGLAFIAYPKEVTLLPVSQLWSSLFFIMIFLLGISTLLTDTLALVTSIGDIYPRLFRGGKYRKEMFMGASCIFSFFIGLFMVSRGGMYVLQLFDFYGASGFALLWTAGWQCVAIGWFYGNQKFYDCVQDMIGYQPTKFLGICWRYISPSLILAILVFSFIKYKPLKYDDYDYPVGGQILGWCMALSSILCVPVCAIWQLYKAKGDTFEEKWNNAIIPKIGVGHGNTHRLDVKELDAGDDQASDDSPPPPYVNDEEAGHAYDNRGDYSLIAKSENSFNNEGEIKRMESETTI